MSTRASGRLEKKSVFDQGQRQSNGKIALKDFINENGAYGEVVDEINRRLALKEAIDAANKSIALSKQSKASRMGDSDVISKHTRMSEVDERSSVARSQAPSQLSLASISQKGK